MMLINNKNIGRDSTIEPAYIRGTKPVDSSSEIITQLQKDVAQLKINLQNLQNQYNSISVQLDQTTGQVNTLTNQINELNITITMLQNQITELQQTIDDMDEYTPIDSDFLNNLEPYNSQEGAG